MTFVSLLDGLLYIITGIVFLVWTYRAYANIYSVDTGNTRFSPGWVVACFFIPILCLFRPYQAFVEMWNRSLPDLSAPIPQSAPPILLCWWLTYIGGGLFGWVLLLISVSGKRIPDVLTTAVDIGLTASSGVLAALIVRHISDRIRQRYNAFMEIIQAPVAWQ